MPAVPEIREILSEAGLKVTPQRVAIFEAILVLNNHPQVENIIDHLRSKHPNIAIGTIYKTLETFVKKGLIKKVKVDKELMRYDAVTKKHHHLHYVDSDKIEDYYDEKLDMLIEQYFNKKKIPNFRIEELQLQIIGRKPKK